MSSRRGEEPPPLPPSIARLRLAGFVVVIAGLAATLVVAGPDPEAVRDWIDDLGWPAPLVFVLVYAALTVALVPGSVLTIAAGLLFGGVLGTVLTLIGATTGATIAFVATRAGARPAVEAIAARWFRRIDRWLEHRGITAVIVLRLLPIVPFSAANYAAGLTAIRLRDFVLGTAVGIVPGTVLYVTLGSRADDPTDPLFLAAAVGLAVLVVISTAVLRRHRDGEASDDTADRAAPPTSRPPSSGP